MHGLARTHSHLQVSMLNTQLATVNELPPLSIHSGDRTRPSHVQPRRTVHVQGSFLFRLLHRPSSCESLQYDI
jgi:hypothetical protein